jgi:hypothetical protein
MPVGILISASTCNPANTTCTIDFSDYPESAHGVLRVIVSVIAYDLLSGGKGGGAGVEFPLVLNIARVTTPGT